MANAWPESRRSFALRGNPPSICDDPNGLVAASTEGGCCRESIIFAPGARKDLPGLSQASGSGGPVDAVDANGFSLVVSIARSQQCRTRKVRRSDEGVYSQYEQHQINTRPIPYVHDPTSKTASARGCPKGEVALSLLILPACKSTKRVVDHSPQAPLRIRSSRPAS